MFQCCRNLQAAYTKILLKLAAINSYYCPYYSDSSWIPKANDYFCFLTEYIYKYLQPVKPYTV
jgi:hypothetical protein